MLCVWLSFNEKNKNFVIRVCLAEIENRKNTFCSNNIEVLPNKVLKALSISERWVIAVMNSESQLFSTRVYKVLRRSNGSVFQLRSSWSNASVSKSNLNV